MQPQGFEPVEAEEVRPNVQDVQPYFEHRLWSEYCFATLIEHFYMNVIEKKLVCRECYRTELTFFECEVTLPVEIDHIGTKDLYYTLKFSRLDCSHCNTIFFYMWQRADLCVTCAERLIDLHEQEALYNDVDSETTTIIYNNE